jgi:hypothetical protein
MMLRHLRYTRTLHSVLYATELPTYACLLSAATVAAARTRQPLGLGSQPSRANLVTDRFVQDRRASTAEAARARQAGVDERATNGGSSIAM